MLRCISQTIEHLQRQRLFFGKEFDFAIAQSNADARVETKGFRGAALPNATAAMQNGSFQQHLKRMIERYKHRSDSPPFEGTIELLNPKEERIAGFFQEETSLAFHGARLPTANRSCN